MTRAVAEVTGERAQIDASGRTDAGVHALAQVASFRTQSTIPPQNLVKALNRLLPASVRVLAAEDAAAEFHARFDARAKTYRYRIYRGEICPPSLWRYVHHFPYPLDEGAMVEAAPLFEGTRDFSSVASAEAPLAQRDEAKSKVRTVFSSRLVRDGDELVYTVRGSGFLHHMVRNMVGTLVEVGKGRLHAADIPALLNEKRRSSAGPTLPAKGLWLIDVEY